MCSFRWADFEDAPGADDERIGRGRGVVTWKKNQQADDGQTYMLTRKTGDTLMRTRAGVHKLPFEKKFEILCCTLNPAGKCKTVWRRGCRVRTELGGELRR